MFFNGLKIIESSSRKSLQTANLEASISTDLRHPNIVATLKSWVKRVDGRVCQGTSQLPILIKAEGKVSLPPLRKEQPSNVGLTQQSRHSTFLTSKKALRAAADPDLSSSSHSSDLCKSPSRQNSNVSDSIKGWPVISMPKLIICDAESSLNEECIGEHDISAREVTYVTMEGRPEDCEAKSYLSGPLMLHQQDPPPLPESLQTWMIMEYCDKGCLQVRNHTSSLCLGSMNTGRSG
jgi:hypothetical protein